MKTWLFYINFFILQWFGLRLARKVESNNNKTVGWKLMHNIKPLSGWNGRVYRKWIKS